MEHAAEHQDQPEQFDPWAGRRWVREQSAKMIAEGMITGRFSSVYGWRPSLSV